MIHEIDTTKTEYRLVILELSEALQELLTVCKGAGISGDSTRRAETALYLAEIVRLKA